MVAEEPGVAPIINMLEMLRMIHATTQKKIQVLFTIQEGLRKGKNLIENCDGLLDIEMALAPH